MLEHVRIDLKVMISISLTKNAPDAPCSYGRERIAERWEKVVKNNGILWLIYIVSIFFIVIKKLQKIKKKNFCTTK